VTRRAARRPRRRERPRLHLHEGARRVRPPRRHAGSARRAPEARELNPHVPDYLTGRKAPPEQRPAYILFGEETEAIDYAAGIGGLWASVPGALDWPESLTAPAVTA
jgi:hypothetical protein